MPKKSRVAFDCVYFQRSCNLSNLEGISLLQEQVAATLLDPRDMPDLNCIPANQHDQALALLRCMVVAVIDEVKNSDAWTDVNESIENVNDFLVTLRRCCCEFFWRFKRRDCSQGDQDMADSHCPFFQGHESSRRVASRCCASFPLAWVSWWGVYLLFLQLQQLPSACFPRRLTWWRRNVHVSRVTTWRS